MTLTLKQTLLAATLAVGSLSATAEGAKFAPLFTDPEFRFEPTVAAVIGALKPENASSDLYAGVEINFNCGLFQTADQRMRTHLAIGNYDKDDLELTTVELSPRYTVPMGSGFSIGVGPGVALVRSEAANRKVSHLALMLAGGVNYRKGAYYAGVDLRYQDTSDRLVNGIGREADNWALATKVGMNF